jgi:PST family polysaccharide transporter
MRFDAAAFIGRTASNRIVGRWLGAEALGFYSLSSQLMTAPAVIFGQILDRVLFPTMALVQQEPARLARAYRSGVAACALFALPSGVIVAIVAPELVLVLLGRGWEGVVVPLQILALGMIFRTSSKLSDSGVRATGAVYARAWRQGVFVVAVVVGALVGQIWGVEGVATAR